MKKKYVLFLMLFCLVFSSPAWAYIDPGTGSLIWQMLIAGILGALFYIKNFWRFLSSFFRKKDDDDKNK